MKYVSTKHLSYDTNLDWFTCDGALPLNSSTILFSILQTPGSSLATNHDHFRLSKASSLSLGFKTEGNYTHTDTSDVAITAPLAVVGGITPDAPLPDS